jgi:hypothetical protein
VHFHLAGAFKNGLRGGLMGLRGRLMGPRGLGAQACRLYEQKNPQHENSDPHEHRSASSMCDC